MQQQQNNRSGAHWDRDFMCVPQFESTPPPGFNCLMDKNEYHLKLYRETIAIKDLISTAEFTHSRHERDQKERREQLIKEIATRKHEIWLKTHEMAEEIEVTKKIKEEFLKKLTTLRDKMEPLEEAFEKICEDVDEKKKEVKDNFKRDVELGKKAVIELKNLKSMTAWLKTRKQMDLAERKEDVYEEETMIHDKKMHIEKLKKQIANLSHCLHVPADFTPKVNSGESTFERLKKAQKKMEEKKVEVENKTELRDRLAKNNEKLIEMIAERKSLNRRKK